MAINKFKWEDYKKSRGDMATLLAEDFDKLWYTVLFERARRRGVMDDFRSGSVNTYMVRALETQLDLAKARLKGH